MATVADILTAAGRACQVGQPDNDSWLGALDDTWAELRDDFLLDTIDDLQQRADWPQPIGATTTLTGDGASEDLALPTDFLRFQRDDLAVYERTATRRRCIPTSDDGEWEYRKELGSAGAHRYYRLKGYEGAFTAGFYRTLETGSTVVVNYITDSWIINGFTYKSTFDDSNDVCLFPRRLVELGILWRYREKKGLDYADREARYEALLSRYATDRNTSRKIDMAGRADMVMPQDIPVPDVIPSA